MSLQFIRDRAQSWIAWLIVGLIIVVFAVWGVNSYFTPDANVSVAVVNGVKISNDQFRQRYQLERFRLQNQLGGNIDPGFLEAIGLREQVLESLVSEEVQIQTAIDLGFRVSDRQIGQKIQQFPEFQENGRFSEAKFKQVLTSQRLTTDEFLAQSRRNELLRQPARGVFDTAIVSDRQIDLLIRIRDQKRRVGFTVIPVSRFSDEITLTDEQIAAYYDEHQAEFVNPEQVKIEYIEIDLDDLAASQEVTEEEIQQAYDERVASGLLGVGERRRVRHILIEVAPDADEAAVAAAREKASGLLQRLRAGEDFAALAREYSDDPGSADSGGDLGFFGRGVMDKTFEEVAFSLEPGQVSDVVRTPYGFHIIRVDEIQEASVKPLDEVREEIRKELQRSRAEENYYTVAEQLQTLAFENPDSLLPAADGLQLQVGTSEFFTRNKGSGIAAEAKVRDVAFSPDVLENGNNSDLIELGDGRAVVLRVKERRAQSVKPLEEVRDEIEQRLRKKQAAEQVLQQAQELMAQLRDAEEPSAVVEKTGLTWHEPALIGRNEAEVDPALLREVFSVTAVPAEQPYWGRVTLAGGDVAVFQLNEIVPGEVSAVSEEDRKALRNRRMQALAGQEYQGLVDTWKRRARIEKFPENL